MALPPDSSESFLREVDENLRRDQARDFAKRYGGWLTGAVIVFLLAVGGYLFWQDRQAKEAAAQSEQLAVLLNDIGSNNTATVPTRLNALSQSPADGIAASALMTKAAFALQKGDRKGATDAYAAIAANKDLPQLYRDLGTLRGTSLAFDQLKPDEVIARLQPLAQPGKPFFGTAGEMTGVAMLAKGQKREAGELFAKIAADKAVPNGIRARAVQMAGSLGVDASASIPTGPLPGAAQ